MLDDKILEDYSFYCKRLDNAIAYNDSKKVIENSSKEYEVLVDIINQCARIESEIKGLK